MLIYRKNILLKLQKKNTGNTKLCKEIDRLIADLEAYRPGRKRIKDIRPDADCVHSEGFYFFDIHVHRTLVLIETEGEGEATIVWAGTHREYEETFKNNRASIEKWLRRNNHIE